MVGFNNFVNASQLCDIKPNNGRFTWTNKRRAFTNIRERLDRFLISKGWMETDSFVSTILPYSASHHFPNLLKMDSQHRCSKGYFIFQSMWWRDLDLKSKLEGWWKESDIFKGTLSFRFVRILNFLKSKLKEWNMTCFKYIFVEKAWIEEELQFLNDKIISSGMGCSEFETEKRLKEELLEILAREKNYWRDEARETWLREGDLNMKFVHASVKVRRGINRIGRIRDSKGGWCLEEQSIGEEAVKFFESVLCNNAPLDRAKLSLVLEVIPRPVSEEDN
ncbi:uncharacterized protein LOC131036583 [Cryptomeria japonica]|uniref:uncharacterized protein LOC131036583 n=1 Tax=Cryptomeria japonica TaxID=3369 RepID=UPI0027DA86F5|nr:uncharacterized protein LOC131036583 [Cryptomeria japonica]